MSFNVFFFFVLSLKSHHELLQLDLLVDDQGGLHCHTWHRKGTDDVHENR